MEITQILLIIALLTVGVFSVSAGVLMIINKKVRDWFAHWWWHYLEDTEAGKKNAKNTVRFFNAPLVIFAGLMCLYLALTFLR